MSSRGDASKSSTGFFKGLSKKLRPGTRSQPKRSSTTQAVDTTSSAISSNLLNDNRHKTWNPSKDSASCSTVVVPHGNTAAAHVKSSAQNANPNADAVLGAASPHGAPLGSDMPDLADEIERILMVNNIGLKETGVSEYLPDGEISRLLTTNKIKNAVGSASRVMLEWILQSASKTFIITVLAFSDRPSRHKALEAFYSHGFNDDRLPVGDIPRTCAHSWDRADRTSTCEPNCGKPQPRVCKGKHKRDLDCFHHQVWTPRAFRRFYDNQWSLLPQGFYKGPNGSMPVLPSIEDKRILPFFEVEQAGCHDTGAFGFVQQAHMLRAYQDTIKPDYCADNRIPIAIKTLQVIKNKRFNIDNEWRNEVAAHKELGQLGEQHLVKAIAAYRYRTKYCFLFEWADGGNLRSYWQDTEHRRLSPDMVREHLEQLFGITGALKMMHNTREARKRRASSISLERDSPRLSVSTISRGDVAIEEVDDTSDEAEDEAIPDQTPESKMTPTFKFEHKVVFDDSPSAIVDEPLSEPLSQMQSAQSEDENWRHGDIKPENILRFKRADSSLGTLKLADLGRAKQHNNKTRERPVREVDLFRTEPYEPPDLYYVDQDKSMSRLFDIWSLGCVFFESIVWMLYGKEWLQEFDKTTKAASQKQTPFWIMKGDYAELSPIIENCLEHILTNDPECNSSEESAVKDLLFLVRDKMLVVDLPKKTEVHTPGTRAHTGIIFAELKRIKDKAANSQRYLFTGRSRSGVSHPPYPEPAVPAALPANQQGGASKRFGPSLAVPATPIYGRSKIEQAHTYSGVLENVWTYDDDNTFVEMTRQVLAAKYGLRDASNAESPLCESCRGIDFMSLGLGVLDNRPVQSLDVNCPLCRLFLERVDAAGPDVKGSLILSKSNTALTLSCGGVDLGAKAHLRLCRAINAPRSRVRSSHYCPKGLPRLLDAGSPASFALLQSWLADCDRGHDDADSGCTVARTRKARPKRLLFVGSTTTKESRIVLTPDTDGLKYVALSHPWGPPSPQNRHFVSTSENIAQRMVQINDDDSELPRNFRDAITVTRELGLQYLWVDALCILQKTDTDPGDFQQEAGSMQDIFSSAYCVLAASSATGMNSGFIRSRGRTPKYNRKAVRVGPPHEHIFVCESPDDFQHDVIDGPLNSRAWVLQERALARRTIHFTDNQIYWECSGGVRCESLSKLANSEAAFLGDSNFPAYAVKDKTKGAQISLFKSLYAAFCRLGFSHETDKPFAISGLEQRLTDRFEDISGAGIFGKHAGRCLLWTRAEDEAALKRIDFSKSNPGAHKPPTWSFMAHIGGIEYIDVPGHEVDWDVPGLNLTGTAARSWIYAPKPLAFSARAWDFQVQTDARIVYDDPMRPHGVDKCVVVGKRAEAYYYVLVVRPTPNAQAGEQTAYERVGAGYIRIEAVNRKTNAVEAQLV